MEDVDEKDRILIEELRKDSKLSEQRLARKTSIPMTTVHNRLRKLRALGVIRGYTLRLDYAKLGRPLVAYVLLKVTPGVDQKEMLEQISKIKNVSEVSMIAGDFDIMLKARISSIAELNRIVVQNLRKQKSIGDARTMLSYETIDIE